MGSIASRNAGRATFQAQMEANPEFKGWKSSILANQSEQKFLIFYDIQSLMKRYQNTNDNSSNPSFKLEMFPPVADGAWASVKCEDGSTYTGFWKLRFHDSWTFRGPVAHLDSITKIDYNNRSEERRVGKECRSRWSPY